MIVYFSHAVTGNSTRMVDRVSVCRCMFESCKCSCNHHFQMTVYFSHAVAGILHSHTHLVMILVTAGVVLHFALRYHNFVFKTLLSLCSHDLQLATIRWLQVSLTQLTQFICQGITREIEVAPANGNPVGDSNRAGTDDEYGMHVDTDEVGDY